MKKVWRAFERMLRYWLLKAYFMPSFNKIVKSSFEVDMRIHKNIPKRILCLCLVFAIGISMGIPSDHFVSMIFRAAWKIIPVRSMQQYPHPSLHSCTPWKKVSSPRQLLELPTGQLEYSLCPEYEELKSFAYSRLSEENRLTCDMLLLYFHTKSLPWKKLSGALDWPLGPGLGVQAQLPILLAGLLFPDKKISLIIWNFWVPSGHVYRIIKARKANPVRAFHERHNSGPYPETMSFVAILVLDILRRNWKLSLQPCI